MWQACQEGLIPTVNTRQKCQTHLRPQAGSELLASRRSGAALGTVAVVVLEGPKEAKDVAMAVVVGTGVVSSLVAAERGLDVAKGPNLGACWQWER